MLCRADLWSLSLKPLHVCTWPECVTLVQPQNSKCGASSQLLFFYCHRVVEWQTTLEPIGQRSEGMSGRTSVLPSALDQRFFLKKNKNTESSETLTQSPLCSKSPSEFITNKDVMVKTCKHDSNQVFIGDCRSFQDSNDLILIEFA